MNLKSIIKIGVLTILMIAHSALANSAQTKVKSCDREVIFDSPPKRAISNDVNLTEMMLVLGLTDRMVGYTGTVSYTHLTLPTKLEV